MLHAKLPALSRSKIQWLLQEGHVTLEDAPITQPKYKVKAGECYHVTLPEAPLTEVVATPMDLDIVYEDADLLVINKAAGLTVHPAAGHRDDTLVNGLLAYCGEELSAIGGEARPGIVHRLDKDTSGLMVVAKNDIAHRKLAEQLADRSLSRTYEAFIWSTPIPQQGTINASIARDPKHRKRMAVVERGKEAITHYKLLEKACQGRISRVECKLETGRTHQIRVHMAHIGHPLIGDPTYSGRRGGSKKQLPEAIRTAIESFTRQALHAKAIGFIHPTTGEGMHFSSELPDDMQQLWHTIKSE